MKTKKTKDVLTLIETAKEPIVLQKFMKGLSKHKLNILKTYIDDAIKIFHKFYELDGETEERWIIEFQYPIGNERKFYCWMGNCEDTSNFSTSDPQMILRFDDINGNSISVKGSGEYSGCIHEEIEEFIKIFNESYKECKKDLGIFRRFLKCFTESE